MITGQTSEVASYASHARTKWKPQSVSACAWSHILAILKLMEAFIVENSKSILANNLYRSRRRNPLILHTHTTFGSNLNVHFIPVCLHGPISNITWHTHRRRNIKTCWEWEAGTVEREWRERGGNKQKDDRYSKRLHAKKKRKRTRKERRDEIKQ